MEYDGISYRLTASELAYLLFGKKKCPKCGGRLRKTKEFDSVYGSELNSRSEPVFVNNAKVKSYRYIFICDACGSRFTLQELADRKKG